MIHKVIIDCKQSERLLDSMRQDGCHTKQEEYDIGRVARSVFASS